MSWPTKKLEEAKQKVEELIEPRSTENLTKG